MPKSWLSDNIEPLDDGPEIPESSMPEAVDDSAVQAAPDTSVVPDWPPPVRLKSPRPKRDIKLPARLRLFISRQPEWAPSERAPPDYLACLLRGAGSVLLRIRTFLEINDGRPS